MSGNLNFIGILKKRCDTFLKALGNLQSQINKTMYFRPKFCSILFNLQEAFSQVWRWYMLKTTRRRPLRKSWRWRPQIRQIIYSKSQSGQTTPPPIHNILWGKRPRTGLFTGIFSMIPSFCLQRREVLTCFLRGWYTYWQRPVYPGSMVNKLWFKCHVPGMPDVLPKLSKQIICLLRYKVHGLKDG